jgi:hypothetical protein
MNKLFVAVLLLLVLLALGVVAYRTFYKPRVPVADNLKQELILTEDDDGVADFKSLDQDALGL